MKEFRKQNPTEIVTRCIILEQVRKINPFDLYKVKPYYANVIEEIEKWLMLFVRRVVMMKKMIMNNLLNG